LRFDRLFWAGDGGVFAAQTDRHGHPQNVCEAADKAFSLFSSWRRQKPVEFRASATALELSLDPDPGNWCGPELNDFLKYERHFALPNAFVITDRLRAALVDRPSIARFPKPRTVPLPNGEVLTSYVDRRHSFAVRESTQSFRAWLRRQIGANKVPVAELLEKSSIRVGRCTVLDSAPREVGYGEILLEPVVGSRTEGVLEPSDRPLWHEAKLELLARKVSGTSMQVTSFAAELSDDLHPRLQYQTVDYVDARAFHLLLERHPDAVRRYRDRALAVLADQGTNIPNILSTAVVVIVGTDRPQLVIANRKARTGGYHGGTWAVSIGEQFMPLSGMRGDRHIDADASLTAHFGHREQLDRDREHSFRAS
jgi:hypothetical protein